MATHTGSEGTVKVGANAIAEIRSFSIEETADTVEDTSMGDTYRTHKTLIEILLLISIFVLTYLKDKKPTNNGS